jgi:hypothetical protein
VSYRSAGETDTRNTLLAPIAFRQFPNQLSAGLDIELLLAAQHEVFQPTIDSLAATSDAADFVELWRRANARAVRRFLGQARHSPPAGPIIKP